uniref:Uncharacterized protein n=1 Tax=Ditylenchus dipsaci TaxID=166011 RepID=A0A915DGY0_9BILA
MELTAGISVKGDGVVVVGRLSGLVGGKIVNGAGTVVVTRPSGTTVNGSTGVVARPNGFTGGKSVNGAGVVVIDPKGLTGGIVTRFDGLIVETGSSVLVGCRWNKGEWITGVVAKPSGFTAGISVKGNPDVVPMPSGLTGGIRVNGEIVVDIMPSGLTGGNKVKEVGVVLTESPSTLTTVDVRIPKNYSVVEEIW